MPFDPHLIRPDDAPLDESGQLVLPDDLAELAAQLEDDSSRLAACYPPASPRRGGPAPPASMAIEPLPVAVLPTRIGRSPQTAAFITACVVAILTGSLLLWQLGGNGGHGPPELPLAEVDHEGREGPTHPVAAALPADAAEEPLRNPWSPSFNSSPAYYLHEYSGPELEGLYDLLGESQDGKISI
jgi:hypothetical protein